MQMHTRLLSAFILTTAMAFGAAVPRYSAAQQTSDQAARQAGDSVVQAHNKASEARDAAGVAALYAGDAIMVTPDGQLVGRAAIEKFYAESFKSLFVDSLSRSV
jgi:SnoaL-like domain